MSILWFIFLFFAISQGIEIDDTTFDIILLMISIFYVGDCILLRNRRADNGKAD